MVKSWSLKRTPPKRGVCRVDKPKSVENSKIRREDTQRKKTSASWGYRTSKNYSYPVSFVSSSLCSEGKEEAFFLRVPKKQNDQNVLALPGKGGQPISRQNGKDSGGTAAGSYADVGKRCSAPFTPANVLLAPQSPQIRAEADARLVQAPEGMPFLQSPGDYRRERSLCLTDQLGGEIFSKVPATSGRYGASWRMRKLSKRIQCSALAGPL